MPVQTDGPKGYEYQYLVSVYIALKYLHKDQISVHIETDEDAVITYAENGERTELFIQVKKHERPEKVSFQDVCSWLGHFGGNQASRFLLKNISTGSKQVLFVTAGRCEDRLLPYLDQDFANITGKTVVGRRSAKINGDDVPDLKEFLVGGISGKTPLSAQRQKTCQEFFKNTSVPELKKVLEKVHIAEQQDHGNVMALTAQLLKTHFAIRPSTAAHVIELLEQCVREGRDSRGNIAPAMWEILNRYAQRLLPEDLDYLEIPRQGEYEAYLEANHVLLLTGLPFCGKTTAAQAIAQTYAAKGFELYQTDDLDEGLKFLNSRTDTPKLLLLEDPLGAIHIPVHQAEKSRKLHRLIQEKISPFHKLIVTTRMDILLAAFDRRELSACAISGHTWNDLTMHDTAFAQSIWQNIYGSSVESLQCFERVAKHICQLKEGVFLEIGEIHSLKRKFSHLQDLSALSEKEIVRCARISSEDVVAKIQGDGADSVRVFRTLSVACDTIRSVSFRELAYLLSDADEQPALLPSKRGHRSLTLGSGLKKEVVQYPDYTLPYDLSSNESQILIQFEKCGYISISRRERKLRFLHPIYWYASQLILLKHVRDCLDCTELVRLGQRGIGALDKNVNLCALDQLQACMEEEHTYGEDLRAVILAALNSRYPAVRDQAILLLEEDFSLLNKQQQEQLLRMIRDTEFDRYLIWQDGEPTIDPRENLEMDLEDLWDCSETAAPTPEQISAVREKGVLSAQAVFETLNSRMCDELPISFLDVALDYDESVIRQRAIYLLFKNHADEVKLENYLSDFEHCGVICQMFQGAMQSWPAYSPQDRQDILNYFTRQLKRVSVSMLSEDFLLNFMDEYRPCGLSWEQFSQDDRILIWESWCVVFTEFLKQFPVDFLSMDEAHMEAAMREMKPHIKKPELLRALFYAWDAWLSKATCPNDYGMCLAQKVIDVLPPEDPERYPLVRQLLQAKSTSVLTSYIRHIVDVWDQLTDNERGALIDLLTQERNDRQWLQAVALTRENIPGTLIALLLDKDCINTPAEWHSALQEKGLLEPCLNIFCGYPQPLWWNGYHHAAKLRWTAVIAEELQSDDAVQGRAFQISLREFIQQEYDYDSLFQEYRKALWTHLLSDPTKRSAVFEQLLRTTASTNRTNAEIWESYFNYCADTAERERSCKRIAEVIEAVEHYQDENGCLDLFAWDIVSTQLLPLLPSDNRIAKMCLSIFQILQNQAIKEHFVERFHSLFVHTVLAEYQGDPPRSKFTDKLVKLVMEETGWRSSQIDDLLESHRIKLLERGAEQAKTFEDEYTLKDWN